MCFCVQPTGTECGISKIKNGTILKSRGGNSDVGKHAFGDYNTATKTQTNALDGRGL